MARHPRPDAPVCPRHAGSHVVFDGRYGAPGHRRQRFRCYPAGRRVPGAEFHRFVEPLPRQMSPRGVCDVCERDVPVHQGPVGARRYRFSTREVAAGLVRVGAGESYRWASYLARRDAGRFPVGRNGRMRPTDHGQLVGDWVEAFAPVVFERFRRFEWPTSGSVVLDHLPFRVKALARRARGPGGISRLGAATFARRGDHRKDNDALIFPLPGRRPGFCGIRGPAGRRRSGRRGGCYHATNDHTSRGGGDATGSRVSLHGAR